MAQRGGGSGWAWGVAAWLALGGFGRAGLGEAVERPREPHPTCTTCHVAGVQRAGEIAPARRSSTGTVCLACHADLAPVPRSAADVPDGVADPSSHLRPIGLPSAAVAPGGSEGFTSFDCLTCHEPHPNGRAYQLRERETTTPARGATLDVVSRFCLSCHVSFGDALGAGGRYTRHPVGVPVRHERVAEPLLDLPLADAAGTATPDDDVVACTTCHRAHTSEAPDLLRWSSAERAAACTTCHPVGAREAPPGHPVARQRRR